MNDTDQSRTMSPAAQAQKTQQKGLNAIASSVAGVAGGAFLVLFLEPVWPVAFGVVGVCFSSAIVFCFLWWQQKDFEIGQ